jgi:hypothetical protein
VSGEKIIVKLKTAKPDKGNFFAGTFCGKHVSERHVFEPHILAYVVVVGNVDTGRNT